MGDKTGIQWTDATWNPVRGCSRVSPGCENCYAERVAARFSKPGQPYHGLAVMGQYGPRWTREVRMVQEHLADPLHWKKPRRIFVNSMSDLFHEELDFEDIAAVFGIMLCCPRHTFQVLTKRAGRMYEWFEWMRDQPTEMLILEALERLGPEASLPATRWVWPLPNVVLGVSVEDEARASVRIPKLWITPAAARMVSYEPALGPVAWHNWLSAAGRERKDGTFESAIDWVIVGGESGPDARPFRLEWARETIVACAEAKVACFVKQLGAQPHRIEPRLKDSHGGDMDEWPPDLRVRQFPELGASP